MQRLSRFSRLRSVHDAATCPFSADADWSGLPVSRSRSRAAHAAVLRGDFKSQKEVRPPLSTNFFEVLTATPDVLIENHFSLFLVRPMTDRAADWLTENIGEDSQYFGDASVCEPRFVADLVEGMRRDGLVVR
jgi:hypothetical protein